MPGTPGGLQPSKASKSFLVQTSKASKAPNHTALNHTAHYPHCQTKGTLHDTAEKLYCPSIGGDFLVSFLKHPDLQPGICIGVA